MLRDLAIETLRDRMLLLRSLPAMAPLDDDALVLLAEHVRLRRFGEGEVLLRMGEPIHHVYIVLEGRVRWQRKGQPVLVASSQEVVGWRTLVARDPDGMDASAVTPGLAIELPAEALEHALEGNFAIVRNLLRLGASNLVAGRGGLPAPRDQAPPVELGTYRPEPRTLVERLIELRSIPLFARCNIEALIALLRGTRELRLPPGEVLFRAGDPSSFWFVVEYGRIACTNTAGERMDVGSSFVIGMMDALGQQPRSYEARAETQVVLQRIELASYLGVLELHADLARDVLANIARTALDRR